MARSLNKVILIGNLGQDPEIRTTGSGTRVAQLSLATERQWTDAQGDAQKRTEWHRIVAWEKLADIAEQYLKKGERVYVEGEIQYRFYEDNEGVTRYVTEIRARELIMLGGREADTSTATPSTPAARQRTPVRRGSGKGPRNGYDDFQPPSPDDDDLPF